MTNESRAWFYSPNGEAQIFERAEDIPPGWQDHPFPKEIAPAANEVSAARGVFNAGAGADPYASGRAILSAFDHDGDGKPGGSKPGRRKRK